MTKMSYVLFVRRVTALDTAMLESDRDRLSLTARELDPSRLPRGFQKGVGVLVAYIADSVEPSARALLHARPKVRFARFYLPAAHNAATGETYMLESTPLFGALYYPKLRFVLGRILQPAHTPRGWPVSMVGVGYLLFIVLLLTLALIRLATGLATACSVVSGDARGVA